jgi:hypothetical protein
LYPHCRNHDGSVFSIDDILIHFVNIKIITMKNYLRIILPFVLLFLFAAGNIAAQENINTQKAETVPVIDGSFDDWSGFSANDLAVLRAGDEMPEATDLTPQFKITWGSDALYLFVTITDEVLVGDHEQAWNNDNVEISIDGNADRSFNMFWEPQASDMKILVKYGASIDDVKSEGNNLENHDLSGLEYNQSDIAGGWAFEMKIPFSAIAADLTFGDGSKIIMEINAGDNDEGPEAKRQHQLSWSGTSNMNNDPSGFGTVYLIEKKNIKILMAETVPVIDGTFDDWSGFTANDIAVLRAGDGMPEETDLAPELKITWGSDALYLLVTIADETLVGDHEQAWNNDNVEISIDGNADRSFNMFWEPQASDMKLLVKYGASIDDVKSEGNNLEKHDLSGLEYNQADIAGGWAFEMKLPFSALAADLSFGSGSNIIMDINVGDNDEGPDAKRQHQLSWSGTSNMNNDPSGFGTVTLKALQNITTQIATSPPVIDGTFDDWSGFSENDIAVLRAGDGMPEATDLAPEFKITWGSDALYLLVTIADETLVGDHEQAWNNDNVEISIDGNADRSFNMFWEPQASDMKLLVKYGSSIDDVKAEGLNLANHDLSGLEYSQADIAGGWAFEMKLPFSAIASDISFGDGSQIIMDINVGDNDEGPDGKRQHQLSWSGTSNMNNDASGFGTINLKGQKTAEINYATASVDGSYDEWADVSAIVPQIVGKGGGETAEDISGEFKLSWDETNLYIYGMVKDEKLVDTDEKLWHNDHVEIALNVADDTNFNLFGGDKLGDNKLSVFFNGQVELNEITELASDVKTVEGGWAFEVSVAFSELNADYVPANDMTFNMEIMIRDNDTDNGSKASETELFWSSTENINNSLPNSIVTLKGQPEEAPAQFSDDETYGTIDSYSFLNTDIWETTFLNDNPVLSINTSAVNPIHPSGNPWFNPDPDQYSNGQESALGALAVVDGQSYGDFEMTLKVAKPDFENENSNFDLAIVFGYSDAENYSYINLNSNVDQNGSVIAAVAEGKGLRGQYVDSWNVEGGVVLADNDLHEVVLKRIGNTITFKYDGTEILNVTDESFGAAGAVGVGSWNDAGYFDDIEVKQLVSAQFADDPIFGNAINYTTLNSDKWEVMDMDGNAVFAINTSDVTPLHPSGNPWFNPDPAQYNNGQESALGEVAVVEGEKFQDFEMSLKIAKPDFENENGSYDIAFIFGYLDSDNYSYININSNVDELVSTIATVSEGKGLRGQNIDSWTYEPGDLLADNEMHEIVLKREGNSVSLSYDGTEILNITDESFGAEGAIGIGSWNDGGYFDDITVNAIEGPSSLNNIESTTLGEIEGTSVKQLPGGTTASELLDAITVSEKATAEIIDADGNAVDGSTELTADMKVRVTAENGDIKEYTIVPGVVLDDDNSIVAVFTPMILDSATMELSVVTGATAALVVEKTKCADSATELVVDADGNEVAADVQVETGMMYRIIAENGDVADYKINVTAPDYPLADITKMDPDNPIIIDAWFDDWANVEPQIDLELYNNEEAPSEDDLSAYIKMTWDIEFLYLYLNVTDDNIVTAEADPWQNDGAEITLLMTGTLEGRAGWNPFWQPETQPGNQKLMYVYGNTMAQLATQGLNTGTDMRSYEGGILEMWDKDDGSGYEVEMQLPWSGLNGNDNDSPLIPENGSKFSMNIGVNDNDGSAREDNVFWAYPNTNNTGDKYALVTLVDPNAIGIKDVGQEQFNVYPNPAKDVLFIKEAAGIEKISFYSINGQTIKMMKVAEEGILSVNLSDLARGVYMMKIVKSDGSVQLCKFVKE